MTILDTPLAVMVARLAAVPRYDRAELVLQMIRHGGGSITCDPAAGRAMVILSGIGGFGPDLAQAVDDWLDAASRAMPFDGDRDARRGGAA